MVDHTIYKCLIDRLKGTKYGNLVLYGYLCTRF